MKRKQFLLSITLASILGGAIALGGYNIVKEDSKVYQTIQRTSPANFTGTSSIPAELNFVEAAEIVRPAVVHVKTYKEVVYNNQRYYHDPFEYFFRDFFGHQPQPQQKQQPNKQSPQERPMGFGSGVIITSDGYIVTNNHVINGADKVEVTMDDKRTYEATVIGTDPTTDIALLKVEDKDLPYINIGNSDNVKVGEWVLAVGNPFNLTSTVTAGIVSAKGRNINIIRDENQMGIESFIQTDAAVNPGNSGGALVNTHGELIGINTAIQSQTGSYTGYSFAVPTAIASKVVSDLKSYGKVQRAILGVSIVTVDSELAEKENLEKLEGVYVASVVENSAAEEADLEKGDVITAINGVSVNTVPELQEQIARQKPGDKISITFDRSGKEKTETATLRNVEGNTSIVKKEELSMASALGADFESISNADLNKFNINNGVKVKKLEAGILRRVGISEGFIITSVDRKPVSKPKDVTSILKLNKEKNRGVLIEGIYPNGKKAYYAVGW